MRRDQPSRPKANTIGPKVGATRSAHVQMRTKRPDAPPGRTDRPTSHRSSRRPIGL